MKLWVTITFVGGALTYSNSHAHEYIQASRRVPIRIVIPRSTRSAHAFTQTWASHQPLISLRRNRLINQPYTGDLL
jgi:hypothetical protein